MMTWIFAPQILITCLRTMVQMPMNLKDQPKMALRGLTWFQHSQSFNTKQHQQVPMMSEKSKEDSRRYSTTTLHLEIDWTFAILSHPNSTRLCKTLWLSKIQPTSWKRKNSIYSFARSTNINQTCNSTSFCKFWPWSANKSIQWVIILFHCSDC